MRVILGVDAAWTLVQPSGVALVCNDGSGWRLAAVASSYQRFHALANADLTPEQRPSGSAPVATALLGSCRAICGEAVDIVAIDMPLSRVPIMGRRASDDAVSRAYGARKASTHTPSATRPGRISDDLSDGFRSAGYPLQTVLLATPGLIEVYPHPALIELANASERLRYKVAKARKYWPELTPSERLGEIHLQWREIVSLLDARISGVAAALGEPESHLTKAAAKAYEDMIDAVVCAWVGICALEGSAVPFGDEASAIWIPQERPP